MPSHLITDLRAIAEGLPEDPAKWPDIPCPTCLRRSVRPIVESLVTEENATSVALREHPNHEVDWISGAFHCLAQCTNSGCDVVRILGTTSVTMGYDDSEYHAPFYFEALHPTLFQPALPLIDSRSNCPDSVGRRVDAAARVLWLDPSSAANRLRSAVEAVMDEQGVAAGTLHSRIEQWAKSVPTHVDTAQLLLSWKYIGNVGSHDDVLRISDVLHDLDVLDLALDLIYDTRREEIRKKAAGIIARRGIPAV
uniref:DUF4145 domain-containing protein n=1 Tax=Streptomyces sp. S501 TaxID=2420135 RepID=UPI00143123E4|nr:DUF4145 domain-containing protein [Streptomyces sp. S501]